MSSSAETSLSGHNRRIIYAGIPSGHKPQRPSTATDRISHLPESILCQILSLLPTKDAVATSLVSRRWRFLWTNIHTLFFSERTDLFRWGWTVHGKERFAEFVKMVLSSINKKRIIDKFHLEINEYFAQYDITSWINTAVALKVKVLEFYLTKLYSTDKPSYRLLHSDLFTCETLEVLVLHGKIRLALPARICLPNVKTLHLEGVFYGSDACVSKLISGCSCLETLFVEREGKDGVVTFAISSPTLRTLTFKFYAYALARYRHPRKLEINAPMLKFLDLLDYVSRDFFVENLCSLDEAIVVTARMGDGYQGNANVQLPVDDNNESDNEFGDEVLPIDNDNGDELPHIDNGNGNEQPHIDNDDANGNGGELLQIQHDNVNHNNNDRRLKVGVGLFEGLHNVKHLSLRFSTHQAFSHAGKFPYFSRLTQLTVEAPYCGWNLLLDLIKAMDKLERLTFTQTFGHKGKVETCWRTPDDVPTCLLASLRKMTIAQSKGLEDELAIAYILKNAKVLETMTIEACYTLLHESVLEFFLKVSEFPRRSEECKIEFYKIGQRNNTTPILISEMGNEIGRRIN